MEPTLISRVGNPRVHVLEVIGNAIVGGMENVVQRLIERLPRERFAITALCPFDSPMTAWLRSRGIDVVVVPMPDDPPWTSVQSTCALVRANGVDVIHAHLSNAHVLGGLVGSLTGRPVVATVHGRQLTMLDLEVHRACNTHVNVVCRHSELHALGLGIDATHLSCIPNGVDTAVFRPGARAAGGLRHELGIDEATPLIGFVGRLSPEKGPEVFVRAALLLRSLLPSARFVMLGEGPMRAALETMIERFGLTDHLALPGLRADMPENYRQLDLAVCTSHSEAMPLALIEAMAAGLPVVATRVGGVPDLIEPGVTGWLVAPGDFQGIADRVVAVVDTPGALAHLGEAARACAVARFDLNARVAETGRLLTELGTRRQVEAGSAVNLLSPLGALTPVSPAGPPSPLTAISAVSLPGTANPPTPVAPVAPVAPISPVSAVPSVNPTPGRRTAGVVSG